MANETTPALPATQETPPQPPPQNEPTSAADSTPKSGRLETVRRVADAVRARFKPGRGRPTKSGAPKKSDTIIDEATGAAVPAADKPALAVALQVESPPPDAALFHRCIVSGVRGAIGGLNDVLKIAGGRAGLDDAFIRKLCDRAAPDAQTVADFSESLQTVLRKHNVNTKNAPEVSLAIMAGRIALPYGAILLELRGEIKRRKEAEQAERTSRETK